MKGIVIAGFLVLLTACGGGSGGSPHPEVLAAFKDHLNELGVELSDAQARCIAGIQQDIFGREDALRSFREPRDFNFELATRYDAEEIQAKLELGNQRTAAECDLEQ